MLMNRIETWTMNNPARALLQRWVEARWLKRKGGRIEGDALEIGCGRGEGIRIIFEKFGAEHVVGVDMDPAQIRRAERRVQRYGDRAKVIVGDAARLEFPDQSFDAVFDFGILHHIPEWREALREVHRVLKPGGRFYFEEVLRGFLETRAAKMFFRHPVDGHFTANEFVAACHAAGLVPTGALTEIGPWFAIGVADKRDGVVDEA